MVQSFILSFCSNITCGKAVPAGGACPCIGQTTSMSLLYAQVPQVDKIANLIEVSLSFSLQLNGLIFLCCFPRESLITHLWKKNTRNRTHTRAWTSDIRLPLTSSVGRK